MATATKTPDYAARHARASQALADPELWEATVEYSDGTLAHREFFMPGGSDENSAKQRAWTIWALAKAGSTGEFLNPSLKVALVVPSLAQRRAA